MEQVLATNVLERFRTIKGFVFDVDGVMTDSSLLVLETGELIKMVNAKDGYAVEKAAASGYAVCIITGGKSVGIAKRFKNLGVQHVYIAAKEKEEFFEDFLTNTGLSAQDILYMGDDMPDIPIMRQVALATCPADAVPEVKAVSQYISPYAGGKGCVRDVIEKVLKLQQRWA